MDAEGVYAGLSFPEAPVGRPYTFINMVSTIDGKILTGGRDEHVMDLGSAVDHASMRQIENAAQAVLIGAGNLRATPKLWYPAHLVRLVATRSGGVDAGCRFFTDAPSKAYVVTNEAGRDAVPAGLQVLAFGRDATDWGALMRYLRVNLGIQRLLVEGGSELNAEVLRRDLVDELFLTLAPKMRLGRDVPTYAGGRALDRSEVQDYDLLSHQVVGSEVFLRYRRRAERSPEGHGDA